MTVKRHRKTTNRKRYKGGADFGAVSYNASMSNPYTTYDVNTYAAGDPSRDIQSARNIIGGRKSRKFRKSRKCRKSRKSRKSNKGGFQPQYYNLAYNTKIPALI